MQKVKPGNTPEKVALINLLLELINDCSLEQIVNRSNNEENTLDLVFTNDPEVFRDYQSIIMAPVSDHKKASFNIIFTCSLIHRHMHTMMEHFFFKIDIAQY